MFTPDRDNVSRASDAPADDAYMITPADSALTLPVRAVRVAVAGDMKITTRAGTVRTLTVTANELIVCGVTQLWATGTTATGFLGYI